MAASPVRGQCSTFAGNAQHTANFPVAAQRLSSLHWSASVDFYNTGQLAHYGQPLVTASNTVIVPVRTFSGGFEINAYDGPTGRLKYTLTNDFVPIPDSGWVAPYQPVLASPGGILTLCYPGPGGTVYYVQNPDCDVLDAPEQVCFYTNLCAYASNAAVYNNAIYIDTPLTADANGDLFFGFRSINSAPNAPTNSGFARLDSAGNGCYVTAPVAAADSSIIFDCHNSAPALSIDGSTLYVAAHAAVPSPTASYGYLLGLDATNLSTKYSVYLIDPTDDGYAVLNDDSTASPTVGPDGDVFIGTLSDSQDGILLHYSADLQTVKTPGAFGWDQTVAIVPTNMLPGYNGCSTYLIFSKYNDYATGNNQIALLDPNATQLDPHPALAGLSEMRELLAVRGCSFGGASVEEWCINTPALNPATCSVFARSEDGNVYRWNLASNSIAEVFPIGTGVGEPYVPNCIGPDGGVYTLNGGQICALGALSNVDIAIYSSAPDLRSVVLGQSVTFSAVVTNYNVTGPVPTGSVTFLDKYYLGTTPVINTLAEDVPLTNGIASVSTDELYADGTNNACHFITAEYCGDTNFPAGASTLVEKIHAYSTVTTLTSSACSNGVSFTAAVSGGIDAPVPTGFAAFCDGSRFLAQLPLGADGTVSYFATNLSAAPHAINAAYTSDRLFASSTGSVTALPIEISGAAIDANGLFQLSFSNSVGASFTVIGTSDPTMPLTNWSVLGRATEAQPGVFQFEDPNYTNNPWQFYCVRSP